MKISKKSNIQPVESCEFAPGVTVVSDVTNIPIQSECPYTQAREFIRSAINTLVDVAGENQIARDSIANLAVVLLDLQNC